MSFLEKTSYRNKFLFVVIAILVLSWLAWQMSFAPTLELSKTKSELTDKISEASNLQTYLQQMQIEKAQLEAILGSSDITPEEMQLGIVSYVADIADDKSMKIEELYPLHLIKEQDCQIATQTIIVSGTYAELVRLCMAFEADFNLARLASVNYWTDTDPKTRKKKLYATYYLQNIQRAV